MNFWLLLNSGKCEAAFNMALDEALLEAMPRLQAPVLRFYGWTEPAATFGYFQKYAEVTAATRLRPLIRRSTGGGIVPHDADWTYSAVFPAGHEWHSLKAEESYRHIHDWLRLAFAELKLRANCRSSAITPALRAVDRQRRYALSATDCPHRRERLDRLAMIESKLRLNGEQSPPYSSPSAGSESGEA